MRPSFIHRIFNFRDDFGQEGIFNLLGDRRESRLKGMLALSKVASWRVIIESR